MLAIPSSDKSCGSASLLPPLSPVLLAGFILRPLPIAALQPILTLAMNLMVKKYDDIFQRLQILNDPIFLIDPIDLPFIFILEPCAATPKLIIKNKLPDDIKPTAAIKGSISSLIELLEGRIDGDALFFSRDLTVEGNTEALLTLRNAVDGADINLMDDILSNLGIFKNPASKIHNKISNITKYAADDLQILRAAVIAPVNKRLDIEIKKHNKLEAKITAMEKENKRLSNKIARICK